MSDPISTQVFAIRRPSPKLLWQYVVHSLAGLALSPVIFLPLLFRYLTLEYHFDAEGIRCSWGILFRREIFLTYARIQDIHVTRGLLERWLGIGTVNLQTASASSGAELSIVGLMEYELVRDYLYSKMRGIHGEHPVAGAPARSPEALLEAILEELRGVNAALKGAP